MNICGTNIAQNKYRKRPNKLRNRVMGQNTPTVPARRPHLRNHEGGSTLQTVGRDGICEVARSLNHTTSLVLRSVCTGLARAAPLLREMARHQEGKAIPRLKRHDTPCSCAISRFHDEVDASGSYTLNEHDQT